VLGKVQSSITREINLNSVRGTYDPQKAAHKAYVRVHTARFQFSAIHTNKPLERYIIAGLKEGYPPQVISGRMKQEKQPWYASKTAIYDWLYSVYGQRYCIHLPYKRYGKRKRRGKKTKRVMIPGRINISKRRKLTRYDFEGDTVVSKKSKTALVVIHNPVTMYGDIRKVSNLKPHTVFLAFKDMLSLVDARSLTLDNGQENRLHQRLGIPTFFCDPHAPWQKPGVENMNKFIRKYIPKKSDIAPYSKRFIATIVKKYNTTPKQKLRWKTPHEVMRQKKLYRNKKNR
jgi:IS30 family transposase